ncbi:hypothetical protein CLV78_102131 [Aliiruegeria haliotis]|uniref:Uncharacterized protein n=1 Tax=Aliiruegeria haliotis TaxID=1280846 RepID=A0A2T0RUZ4_9RHOB|nr:hypothetical protein CLV78_102131 [Aliiruegeria haliotis]
MEKAKPIAALPSTEISRLLLKDVSVRLVVRMDWVSVILRRGRKDPVDMTGSEGEASMTNIGMALIYNINTPDVDGFRKS